MKKPYEHEPFDALSAAYEKMHERVVEGLYKATEKSGAVLHKLIDRAKHQAVELEELTEEDSAKVAGWLKRDWDEASNYLAETGHEIREWLGFETTLVESALLDRLLQVADKTTLGLMQLKEQSQRPYVYKTGEITGPGSLVCDQCGEILHFHKTGRIPPCPKCHGVLYRRRGRKAGAS
ncbi:MAG: zinc ribbon-containing protein [Gammaproteobacteria bacterium]|nr:zinc ribbon-containing protein [Gammaproteobacteria bacterium]